MDNHEAAIRAAQHQALEMGLSNVDYRITDAAAIDGDKGLCGRFDYVRV
ncbi:MAG: hypothetical protein R2860_04600 [Desulfobacterales bacterium]